MLLRRGHDREGVHAELPPAPRGHVSVWNASKDVASGAGERKVTDDRHACMLRGAWHDLRGAADVEVALDLHERRPVKVLDLNLKLMRAVGLVPRYPHHHGDPEVADRHLPVGLQRGAVMFGPASTSHVEKSVDRLHVIRQAEKLELSLFREADSCGAAP